MRSTLCFSVSLNLFPSKKVPSADLSSVEGVFFLLFLSVILMLYSGTESFLPQAKLYLYSGVGGGCAHVCTRVYVCAHLCVRAHMCVDATESAAQKAKCKAGIKSVVAKPNRSRK